MHIRTIISLKALGAQTYRDNMHKTTTSLNNSVCGFKETPKISAFRVERIQLIQLTWSLGKLYWYPSFVQPCTTEREANKQIDFS